MTKDKMIERITKLNEFLDDPETYELMNADVVLEVVKGTIYRIVRDSKENETIQ